MRFLVARLAAARLGEAQNGGGVFRAQLEDPLEVGGGGDFLPPFLGQDREEIGPPGILRRPLDRPAVAGLGGGEVVGLVELTQAAETLRQLGGGAPPGEEGVDLGALGGDLVADLGGKVGEVGAGDGLEGRGLWSGRFGRRRLGRRGFSGGTAEGEEKEEGGRRRPLHDPPSTATPDPWARVV